MTSPRNSKQYLLNSRKSAQMWIMPKKKSRWVNCRVLPGNTNCSCWKKTHFYYLYRSQSLSENLDTCGRVLTELDYSVQEFGRRNPLLAKQLGDAISKLSEMHRHTTRLADCRNNWLKKVSFFRFSCCPVCRFVFLSLACVGPLQAVCYLDEYNEMLDFIVRWSEKAKSLLRANIIWNSSVHLQEQIRMYQVSYSSRQT